MNETSPVRGLLNQKIMFNRKLLTHQHLFSLFSLYITSILMATNYYINKNITITLKN